MINLHVVINYSTCGGYVPLCFLLKFRNSLIFAMSVPESVPVCLISIMLNVFVVLGPLIIAAFIQLVKS